MGLVLSLVVVCVGVIEALSCYHHFQYGVLHFGRSKPRPLTPDPPICDEEEDDPLREIAKSQELHLLQLQQQHLQLQLQLARLQESKRKEEQKKEIVSRMLSRSDSKPRRYFDTSDVIDELAGGARGSGDFDAMFQFPEKQILEKRPSMTDVALTTEQVEMFVSLSKPRAATETVHPQLLSQPRVENFEEASPEQLRSLGICAKATDISLRDSSTQMDRESRLNKTTSIDFEQFIPLDKTTSMDFEQFIPLDKTTSMDFEQFIPLDKTTSMDFEQFIPIDKTTSMDFEQFIPLDKTTSMDFERSVHKSTSMDFDVGDSDSGEDETVAEVVREIGRCALDLRDMLQSSGDGEDLEDEGMESVEILAWDEEKEGVQSQAEDTIKGIESQAEELKKGVESQTEELKKVAQHSEEGGKECEERKCQELQDISEHIDTALTSPGELNMNKEVNEGKTGNLEKTDAKKDELENINVCASTVKQKDRIVLDDKIEVVESKSEIQQEDKEVVLEETQKRKDEEVEDKYSVEGNQNRPEEWEENGEKGPGIEKEQAVVQRFETNEKIEGRSKTKVDSGRQKEEPIDERKTVIELVEEKTVDSKESDSNEFKTIVRSGNEKEIDTMSEIIKVVIDDVLPEVLEETVRAVENMKNFTESEFVSKDDERVADNVETNITPVTVDETNITPVTVDETNITPVTVDETNITPVTVDETKQANNEKHLQSAEIADRTVVPEIRVTDVKSVDKLEMGDSLDKEEDVSTEEQNQQDSVTKEATLKRRKSKKDKRKKTKESEVKEELENTTKHVEESKTNETRSAEEVKVEELAVEARAEGEVISLEPLEAPEQEEPLEQVEGPVLPQQERRMSTKEAFWLIFSGEYTKAMSKDWHSGHFSCWQCDEALTGQRYVLRDDHPHCIKCYENVFANVCEECNKIIGIDSKDLSYKDKHWHEACFLCNKCRVSLVDKQFGSKADKIYCGNCYDAQFASRCDGCGEIFRAGTKKMEYKTRQWHEKCFCCCVCKTPIGTKSFIPREQEIYCATCYEEKFATRCVKCNKVITSGGVTYKNEPWHRECFTCSHCNASLAGQRFTSRDEKPYCAECFGELFAKRCTACTKPITGIGGTRFISFEDRHWHNDCFICASCKTSLVGRGFITDGDDIICPECAKQKLM